MAQNKYITVFCSAYTSDERYMSLTGEVGDLMNSYGYNLVWGASDRGLMKVIAGKVKDGGGKIIGVTVDFLKEHARQDADEIILAGSLGERKIMMLARGDAVVVLPGGTGTLDELLETIELKKHGQHHKPVVVLNTDHFYDGVKIQLTKMREDGFIPVAIDTLLYFAETPKEAMNFIHDALH